MSKSIGVRATTLNGNLANRRYNRWVNRCSSNCSRGQETSRCRQRRSRIKELTYSEARALTDRIREHRDELRLEVYQAWAGKAWLALGHDGWKDYVIKEFQQSRSAICEELQDRTNRDDHQ